MRDEPNASSGTLTFSLVATFTHPRDIPPEELRVEGYTLTSLGRYYCVGGYEYAARYAWNGEGVGRLREHLERVLGIEPPSAS